LLALIALPAVAVDAPTRAFETAVPVRAITRGPLSHWFSYYDKQQFDITGRYALGMEVDFDDRTPTPDDKVVIGMVDLGDGDKWLPLAESHTWSWQQGCMLQWLPGNPGKIIYNDRRDGRFVSVIRDAFTGEERVVPRPVYAVSPDGKRAVSLNFARVDDTRPGYGYKGVVDPGADDFRPADDGIWLVDLETGESKLVVTIKQIADIPQDNPTDGKHWFNHLLFNPDGTRFIFLHRAYRRPIKEGGFITRMFTADPDGSNLRCIADHGLVSHFIWRNPHEILAWSTEPEKEHHFHLYDDQTGRVQAVGPDVLTRDGHCTYSPDGQWILTDGYRDGHSMQPLMLYRPEDGRLETLGKFYIPPERKDETRCDLHPRWNRDGSFVCIDSTHQNGQRQMYLLDVRNFTQKP
ncbi:MAG TPA: hypothetical protein VMZ06_03460, partial [Candidatus Bathyarchaeia archaeon]|nr:hypothetical protein [Candidatus Bathyarchaeia archaeon]